MHILLLLLLVILLVVAATGGFRNFTRRSAEPRQIPPRPAPNVAIERGMAEIKSLLLAEARVMDRDWTSLSVAYTVSGGRPPTLYGFLYHDRDWEPFAPLAEARIIAAMRDLGWMFGESRSGLFRLWPDGLSDFEYHDRPDAWVPDPFNEDRLPKAMR